MANPLRLTLDTRGRWRRQNLGHRFEGGEYKLCTFVLGKDHEEACKRVVLLHQMWDAVKANWHEDKPPHWTAGQFEVAQAVARGETKIALQPPAWATNPELQAGYLADLRTLFPFLNLSYADEQVEEINQQFAERLEEDAAKLRHRAKIISEGVQGTLHQALDAYLGFVSLKYAGKSNLRPQQRIVELLKKHHRNIPLERLDSDCLNLWLAYWSNRPDGQRGKLAPTTCRNVLIGLRSFLRWLNGKEQFAWEFSKGYSFPRCKIERGLIADRVARLRRKHFKRQELFLLWKHAHPFDRALMVLALNCAFSKMEIATLVKDEIVKRKDKTFIERTRKKTGVYGKWLLWQETLEALNYLARRKTVETDYVVVNSRGKNLERGTPKGNENQVIKNHWDRLLERVCAENLNFHRLPFKCLRKTSANYVRKIGGAEVAVIHLAHGEANDGKDPLLRAYTERSWSKVYRATNRLRKFLLPVFTSVPEPWKEGSFRIPPGRKEKILALRREGKNYKEIAEITGLHEVTVGSYCRAAGLGR